MMCASGKISPTLLSRWRGAPRCLISLDDSLCSFMLESQLLELSNLQSSSTAPRWKTVVSSPWQELEHNPVPWKHISDIREGQHHFAHVNSFAL